MAKSLQFVSKASRGKNKQCKDVTTTVIPVQSPVDNSVLIPSTSGECSASVSINTNICYTCNQEDPPRAKYLNRAKRSAIVQWVDCDKSCGRWFHEICLSSSVDPAHFVCSAYFLRDI